MMNFPKIDFLKEFIVYRGGWEGTTQTLYIPVGEVRIL